MREKSKIIVPIMILIFLGGGGLIFNQSLELPEPGLTPDSPFYFLDTFGERIGLLFTFSSLGKTEKALEYAEEKLAEMKIMADKDRIKDLKKANRNYNLYLDLVHQEANQIVDLISSVSQRILGQRETISEFLLIQMEDEFEQEEEIKVKIEKKLDQSLYIYEGDCKSPFEIYGSRGNQLFLRECAIRNQKECQEGELKTVEKLGGYECVQLEESYIWDQESWVWRENLCGDLPYKEWIKRELDPGEYELRFRVYNNENCSDLLGYEPGIYTPRILPSPSFSFESRKEFRILEPSPYEGWEVFLHPYYKYEMRYPPELNLAESKELTPWFSSSEITFGLNKIVDFNKFSYGNFRKDWRANYPGRENEFESVNLVNAYALLSPLVVKADKVEREVIFVGNLSSEAFLFNLEVKRDAIPEKLEIARKMIESFVFPGKEDLSQYLPPEQTITLEKIVQIGEIEGIQTLEKAHDFYIRGDLIYITTTIQGLIIFDISDLTYPKFIGRLTPPEESFYDAIFVGDKYAFITRGIGGMDIVNISDPSQPKRVSHFSPQVTPYYARTVVAKNNIVYLGGDGSLIGIDISDPRNPQEFKIPIEKVGKYLKDLEISENKLYGTGTGRAQGRGSFILDITDPKKPRLITTEYGLWEGIAFDVSEDLFTVIGPLAGETHHLMISRPVAEGFDLDFNPAFTLKLHPAWGVGIEDHNYVFVIEGSLKEQYLEVFDLRTFLWMYEGKIPPTLHRLVYDYLKRESVFQKEIKIYPRKIEIIGDKLYLLYANEGVEVYKIKIEQAQ